MAKIKIKNVGPIVDVEIEINKVNIITGPQSSGKSTIAKLVSYCQWVEKRRMLDGEYQEDIQKQFLDFHHFHKNYFDENSFFEYESNFAKISYSGKELKESIEVNEKNILDYKKIKNIYIPAERNFVSVIPNLNKYNEKNDNIMNLIYDWFTAKQNFDKHHSLPLLNFDINYYYQNGADLDMLILNKKTKEIPLKTGSSGLQSVTPLLVIIQYLAENIYRENPVISVKEKEYLHKILKDNGVEVDNNLHTYGFDNPKGIFIHARRNFYHGTNFIIEEPEQNLFPETQRDLIYHILSYNGFSVNVPNKDIDFTEQEHSLIITTHSPYILYAINNCMLGGLVNSQLEGAEKEEFLSESFLSKKSWIDPKLVSVWEIDNGKLRQIQDQDNIISQNYFDTKMTELMDEYSLILNYYKDEDER
ncbi:MAG: ATP-binding protein [Dysgonamonadaceae bacterium]|nr:ATP-binding protein [Dysgonamonadaceae bacterium]